MLCRVCKRNVFVLSDGKYFCKECSTEVHETREETSDNEGYSRRTLLSSPAVEKKFADKRKLLESWTTIEAYNIILCKQVSALIQLGASEKLKDVVLYIWSEYLKKCELAFRTDSNDDQTPCLSAYAKYRDVKVLYGSKVIERKKKYLYGRRRKKKSKIISKKKGAKTKYESSDSCEVDSDLKIDTASDASTTEQSTSEDDSRKNNTKFSSHAQALRNNTTATVLKRVHTTTKEICVHNMSLSKTLCFCYLGLLYTEDQLLLSDILRFVYENRIPYLNATDYLPSTMKLQCDDYVNFTTLIVPDLWKISLMSAKLFDFLKLPKFKHRPLMPIVICFIKDLNLPYKMIPVIKVLIDKSKKEDDIWYETKKFSKMHYLPIPLYEVQAMAFIITVLKMIFVLDGKYELDHSEVMTKINVVLQEKKLFVWNKWKEQASTIEDLFMKPGTTYGSFSFFDSLSAHQIISKYPYTRLKLEDLPNKSSVAILFCSL